MFGAGTDYCLLLVVPLRRQAAPDGVGCRRPCGRRSREAAPPMVASGMTVIAALLDDARRRLRRLPHVRARDCDRHRGRPALRPHAAARASSPPRAPRVLAERRVGRLPGDRSRARQRQMARDRASAFAGDRAACLGAPSLILLVARRACCSGSTDLDPLRQFRTTNDSSQGYDDPEVSVPAGHGQPHVDPRRAHGRARPARGPRRGHLGACHVSAAASPG